MYEKDEDRPMEGMVPGTMAQDRDDDDSYQTIETASEDRILTEDLPS